MRVAIGRRTPYGVLVDQVQRHAWAGLRRRAFWLAVALIVAGIVSLYFAYHYQPSPVPSVHARQHGKLSPELFSVIQAIATTMLGLGLLSLVAEVFLRESYGRDLLRFLHLRTAIVRSGLQHVVVDSEFDWSPVLRSSKIDALIRDPSSWVMRNLSNLLAACEESPIAVRVFVPDVDGPMFDEVASTVGLPPDDLKRNIETTRQAVENQWHGRLSKLDKGSTFSIVPYTEIPLYETIVTDRHVVLLLVRTVAHGIGDEGVTLSFEQSKQDYPSNWLRESVGKLPPSNPLWAGRVP